VGKDHWAIAQYEEALPAFRQAVAAQRRVHEQAPSVEGYRAMLSHGSGSLAEWLRARGYRAEAASYLREQEKLWPGDARRLREVASDFKELAAAVGAGSTGLTPAEQAERKCYLEESDRVARKANALSRSGTETPA